MNEDVTGRKKQTNLKRHDHEEHRSSSIFTGTFLVAFLVLTILRRNWSSLYAAAVAQLPAPTQELRIGDARVDEVLTKDAHAFYTFEAVLRHRRHKCAIFVT